MSMIKNNISFIVAVITALKIQYVISMSPSGLFFSGRTTINSRLNIPLRSSSSDYDAWIKSYEEQIKCSQRGNSAEICTEVTNVESEPNDVSKTGGYDTWRNSYEEQLKTSQRSNGARISEVTSRNSYEEQLRASQASTNIGIPEEVTITRNSYEEQLRASQTSNNVATPKESGINGYEEQLNAANKIKFNDSPIIPTVDMMSKPGPVKVSTESEVWYAYTDWCRQFSKLQDEKRFQIFFDHYIQMEAYAMENNLPMQLTQCADMTFVEYNAMLSNVVTQVGSTTYTKPKPGKRPVRKSEKSTSIVGGMTNYLEGLSSKIKPLKISTETISQEFQSRREEAERNKEKQLKIDKEKAAMREEARKKRQTQQENALAKQRADAEAAAIAKAKLKEEEAAKIIEERKKRQIEQENAAEKARLEAEAAAIAKAKLEEEVATKILEERNKKKIEQENAAEKARLEAEAAAIAMAKLKEEEAAKIIEERNKKKIEQENAAEKARLEAEAAAIAKAKLEEEEAAKIIEERKKKQIEQEKAAEIARLEAEAAAIAKAKLEEKVAAKIIEERNKKKKEQQNAAVKARLEAEAAAIVAGQRKIDKEKAEMREEARKKRQTQQEKTLAKQRVDAEAAAIAKAKIEEIREERKKRLKEQENAAEKGRLNAEAAAIAAAKLEAEEEVKREEERMKNELELKTATEKSILETKELTSMRVNESKKRQIEIEEASENARIEAEASIALVKLELEAVATEKARLEAEGARIAAVKAVGEQKALLAEKRRENELLAAVIARQQAELEQAQQIFSAYLLDSSSPVSSLNPTKETLVSVSPKEKSSGGISQGKIVEKKDKPKKPSNYDIFRYAPQIAKFEFPPRMEIPDIEGVTVNSIVPDEPKDPDPMMDFSKSEISLTIQIPDTEPKVVQSEGSELNDNEPKIEEKKFPENISPKMKFSKFQFPPRMEIPGTERVKNKYLEPPKAAFSKFGVLPKMELFGVEEKAAKNKVPVIKDKELKAEENTFAKKDFFPQSPEIPFFKFVFPPKMDIPGTEAKITNEKITEISVKEQQNLFRERLKEDLYSSAPKSIPESVEVNISNFEYPPRLEVPGTMDEGTKAKVIKNPNETTIDKKANTNRFTKVQDFFAFAPKIISKPPIEAATPFRSSTTYSINQSKKSAAIPVISGFIQNSNGSIYGRISNSDTFPNGTEITTSPVSIGAKAGMIVTTSSGSKYLLV